MALKESTRIFQEKSIPTILKQVLGGSGIIRLQRKIRPVRQLPQSLEEGSSNHGTEYHSTFYTIQNPKPMIIKLH